MASIATLGEEFKKIANIDVLDKQTGQLRTTYDILDDMAEVYPTLTANQRQYLSKLKLAQVKQLELTGNPLEPYKLQRNHEIKISVNV